MSPYEQTATALRKLLKAGDEVDRCYAARALGTLGDRQSVEPLIDCLRDEDIDVCVDAAEALGRINDISALPSLIESLENDSSGEVCTVVAESLGKLGSPQAEKALTKVILERPERLEWDDEWDIWWDVQLAAVKALGKFGKESGIAPLLAIIDDEGHQDIESELLATLAQIPGKGVENLINRLQNTARRGQCRWRAAKALGRTNSPEATKALGRALQDKLPEVRGEAALALAEQGAQRYLSAILLLLRDEHEAVRKDAMRAACKLADIESGNKELPEGMLALIEDPSTEIRSALFELLALLIKNSAAQLDDTTFESVIRNLDSEDFNTASASCTLLGNNADPRALPELIRVLDDTTKYQMTRRQAALALGKLGEATPEVIDSLKRAVSDNMQPVRLAALSALRALHNESDQPAASGIEPAEEATAVKLTAEAETPLDIIIAAVQGKIKLETDSEAESEPAATPEETAEAPVEPGETLQTAEAGDDTEEQEPPLILPENEGKVVSEGEVKPAVSTLDAIAIDNVETALGLHEEPEAAPELDEETLHYMGVVESNKAAVRRMRSQRHIKPEQDVRQLGVRVLIGMQSDAAINTLIEALNDDDPILRYEAALAVAETARQDNSNPRLMDTLGSLVAQLALGDHDMRGASARALGALGNQGAIQPLVDALQDEDINVRVQVIDALANLVVNGIDPVEADHMVLNSVTTEEVLQKIGGQLGEKENSLRVTAGRALARIIEQEEAETIAPEVVQTIIDSVFIGDGQEARLQGKALRAADTTLVVSKLLEKLDSVENSVMRSVVIEMLEELLKPEGESELAA